MFVLAMELVTRRFTVVAGEFPRRQTRWPTYDGSSNLFPHRVGLADLLAAVALAFTRDEAGKGHNPRQG
jgi:hypothetical protein